MAKTKTQYTCNDCGSLNPKWVGQCPDCGAWNTLTEVAMVKASASRWTGYAGAQEVALIPLPQISAIATKRLSTGLPELDQVLGGGVVEGSVILIGGDPGIGKSTLLLQALANVPDPTKALYVTGEESLQQVSLRAKRLGVGDAPIKLLAETQVETIIALATTHQPKIMVIDSVQTIFTQTLQSAPGSVSQVRESAAHLVRFAKQSGISLYLVGHVNKDGAIAGPRVLEHMVDTVLYFEGEKDSRFRMVRAIKNRFGAVNELGIFAMTDKGLRGVSNPSAIFLSRNRFPAPGTVVMVTWEGSRPLLIEIQALVDDSHGIPRRVTVGYDHNRLALLLAVLNRHGGIAMHQMDVFLNVVGGVKITETGADLAILVAVLSSFRNKIIDNASAFFGEIGLGGELRPVPGGQERILEAAKHGFKRIIVPKANAPRQKCDDIEVIAVNSLSEALANID
ncbi:MAG: DNA repair protein RadA [Gammaproteobacteria bacterium]|nr:DNA repair protein RadA [Gammaproteobacteria bacterium]